MADITPALKNIDQNETKYGASVSENTMTKVGGSINFLNTYWYHSYTFNFLGPFHSIQGAEDGLMIIPFDAEIAAITGRCRVYGTSGNTVLDIHKVSGSTDSGTVLSTKITLSNAVTDGQGFGSNFITSTSATATGVTLPVFSSRNFDAFQGLRLDIDSNAAGARDLTLNVWFRAR